MGSQIVTNINNFVKKRLIESLGVLLVLISVFLLVSIVSYSPSDPNFIYSPENVQIKNVGGFYGSVISDFFLQSLGLVSFLLVFNFLFWGLALIREKIINNFTSKIFYIIVYLIFGTTALSVIYNPSFWLIDNGNGGFVGQAIKENIFYFTPLIENQYIVYIFILLTIVFFILSLSLKINEISKILFSPLILIKKIFILFNKGKTNDFADNDFPNDIIEQKNSNENNNKIKQPILPFQIKKKENNYKKSDTNFKLPSINLKVFLIFL